MGILTCWNKKQSKCKYTIPNLYEFYLLNSGVVSNVTINRKYNDQYKTRQNLLETCDHIFKKNIYLFNSWQFLLC